MSSVILSDSVAQVRQTSKRLEVYPYEKAEEKVVIPFHEIDRVIVVGTPAITIPALVGLLREGIPISFVSKTGRWQGELVGEKNLNAERRILQYRRAECRDFALLVAQKLIVAKLLNSRRVLQRLAANRGQVESADHREACALLKQLSDLVLQAQSVGQVRGYEGQGAACYYSMLGRYFPSEMPFVSRNRQPPKDAANALLSWTYTILQSEMETAVRTHGLDVAIGCLHENRRDAPSLSLDLMEPLRPAVADLLVLHLVNHHVLKADEHFEYQGDDGGVYLNAAGRKLFFEGYEHAMNRRFIPKKETEKTDYRAVIRQQVYTFLQLLEREANVDFFHMP